MANFAWRFHLIFRWLEFIFSAEGRVIQDIFHVCLDFVVEMHFCICNVPVNSYEVTMRNLNDWKGFLIIKCQQVQQVNFCGKTINIIPLDSK